jgi:glycosyltransferase involved in cell wall biosynthesis
MNNNLISVIMPVYNTEKYVRESIESVLSQTYKNIEIICINDGSLDSSLSILESFGDKIITINCKNNCGQSEARNKGVHMAKGEYLAFIDADDIWESKKLEIQLKQFISNPNLDISFTNMKCFISPELSEDIKSHYICPVDIVAGYIPSTVFIKNTSFKKVGYFDPKWKEGEFIDWLVKAKDIGLKQYFHEDVLLSRRIHETNIGAIKKPETRDNYLKIIRESLERRKNKNI